jgi:hypothetical protein
MQVACGDLGFAAAFGGEYALQSEDQVAGIGFGCRAGAAERDGLALKLHHQPRVKCELGGLNNAELTVETRGRAVRLDEALLELQVSNGRKRGRIGHRRPAGIRCRRTLRERDGRPGDDQDGRQGCAEQHGLVEDSAHDSHSRLPAFRVNPDENRGRAGTYKGSGEV